ncbi:MAG: DUF2971 domain-containing protein [Bacteroides sp.]|nr:DUF2971 domain-containing protein [Bacteroides sp.]
MKIGDFVYKDSNAIFDIRYDTAKYPKPKTFYKYYSLSENSIDAIKTPYLYASHPNQLNDPLDCHADIINLDDEETLRCLLDGDYDAFVNVYGIDWIKKNGGNVFKTIAYRKCGIVSLTENPNNEAMWVHYAKANGFCVELDVEKLHESIGFYGPYPINYQEKLPRINISQIGIRECMAVQTNIKLKDWAYEREWRLIVSNPEGKDLKNFSPAPWEINFGDEHDRKFKYSVEAIKQIVFRLVFFKEEKRYEGENGNPRMETSCCRKRCLLDFISQNNIPISIQYMSPANPNIQGDAYIEYSVCSAIVKKVGDSTYEIIENE